MIQIKRYLSNNESSQKQTKKLKSKFYILGHLYHMYIYALYSK
jgi:hypothetical protein